MSSSNGDLYNKCDDDNYNNDDDDDAVQVINCLKIGKMLFMCQSRELQNN